MLVKVGFHWAFSWSRVNFLNKRGHRCRLNANHCSDGKDLQRHVASLTQMICIILWLNKIWQINMTWTKSNTQIITQFAFKQWELYKIMMTSWHVNAFCMCVCVCVCVGGGGGVCTVTHKEPATWNFGVFFTFTKTTSWTNKPDDLKRINAHVTLL